MDGSRGGPDRRWGGVPERGAISQTAHSGTSQGLLRPEQGGARSGGKVTCVNCQCGRKEGSVLFNDALNTFYLRLYGRKEGSVLFNDALNTFYLRLYGRKEGRKCFI